MLSSPVPQALYSTLAAAANLTRLVTKPNGEITQWGDNDSGRLVKLQPAWRDRDTVLMENVLDQRSFVAAVPRRHHGTRQTWGLWAGNWAERVVASALAGGRVVTGDAEPLADVGDVREAELGGRSCHHQSASDGRIPPRDRGSFGARRAG